jgi:predicted GH43/DUF377 family glycosyl hydrolase
MINRRRFLSSAAVLPLLAKPRFEPIPDDLRTPYKTDRLVIAPSRESDGFDHEGADAPFVFRYHGSFYMTYVGFDGEGYQTGLASSANLLDWKKEGVILRRDPGNPVTRYNIALTWILRENGVFSSGSLKSVQGRHLGIYHSYPKPGSEEGSAVIGLCWSPDLREWELEKPFLRPETGQAWEQGGLSNACLLEHQGTYYAYYNAKTRGRSWREQTGFVTTSDLRTWKRFAGNPVIRNGPRGSVDEIFASDPCVLQYADGWAMFYYSLDGKGVARDVLALSPDLRRVTKCRGALVDLGPPGSVDSKYAHKPSVIFHDGVLYHFYCAVSPEFGRGISVATSRPV